MNYKKPIYIILLLITVCISGCTSSTSETSETISDNKTVTKSNLVSYEEDDYYTDYTKENYETIDGDSQKGTIEITKAGTYVIQNEVNGNIVVNTSKDAVVRMVLNNATINSSNTSPIQVTQAKKVIISLPKDTTNTISDRKSYTLNADQEPSAAIFSKDDLTINGEGTLNLTASYKNGIQSKDTLKLMDGNLNITATNDGLKGKDQVLIHNGSYTLNVKGDGIVATNVDSGNIIIEDGKFTITSQMDGIQATGNVSIANGTYTINTAGGSVNKDSSNQQPWGQFNDRDETSVESTKGIKADKSITLKDGTVTISSVDDSLHANENITIEAGTYTLSSDDDGIHADKTVNVKGGTVCIKQSYEGIEGATINLNGGTTHVTASDDGINAASDTSVGKFTITGGTHYVDAEGDGLDSNGDIVMNGGMMVVMGPTSGGNGTLDYDGTFQMNGGILLAAGSSSMAMAPSSSSKQASIIVSLETTQNANNPVYISDANGHSILGMIPSKRYQTVIISSPDIVMGESYTLYSGGKAVNQKNGYFSEASGGNKITTQSIASTVTTYGNTNMMGGRRRP